MSKASGNNRLGPMLRVYQALLLVACFALWHYLVQWNVLPKFFFGEPVKVLVRTVTWFTSGTIWPHLGTTLQVLNLAFCDNLSVAGYRSSPT